MTVPPPARPTSEPSAIGRPRSGRALGRSVRVIFAVVFVVAGAGIAIDAVVERARLRAVAEERALLLARSGPREDVIGHSPTEFQDPALGLRDRDEARDTCALYEAKRARDGVVRFAREVAITGG